MGMCCSLFIEESVDESDSWNVQLQFKGVTVNLHASSLSFLHQTLGFIRETLNNPQYRDEEGEAGRFHRMSKKSCDLSSYFDIPISITKDGEYDDSYIVLSLSNHTWIYCDLRGEAVNALVDELETAIEDWL
jgi:hypothetical protein